MKTRKLKIAFIGRLEKDTSILQYCGVISLLKNQGIKCEFNIYGEGSLKNQIMIGNLQGITTDVDSIIDSHDILFVSSYLSILDSLNHQKIVVSIYDNPLKKDYLYMSPFKDWIVIGETAQDISKKLVTLLKDKKKLQDLIQKGKEWVDTQSWSHLVNQYEQLWEK